MLPTRSNKGSARKPRLTVEALRAEYASAHNINNPLETCPRRSQLTSSRVARRVSQRPEAKEILSRIILFWDHIEQPAKPALITASVAHLNSKTRTPNTDSSSQQPAAISHQPSIIQLGLIPSPASTNLHQPGTKAFREHMVNHPLPIHTSTPGHFPFQARHLFRVRSPCFLSFFDPPSHASRVPL